MLSSTQNSVSRVDLAEQLLGHIDWLDNTQGYCTCPGISLHTGGYGYKDCKVFLNGAPTIYCQHVSCNEMVAEFNYLLRCGVGRHGGISLSPEQKKAIEERQRQLQKEDSLKRRARAAKQQILAAHPWPYDQLRADSPTVLDLPEQEHWRLLLNQFGDRDVVWIGDLYHSGQDHHTTHFRTRSEWLRADSAPGQFTCPATFKEGSFSRSKENTYSWPFLVIESDTLSKDQIGAVFRWLCESVDMNLKAVVDTGGKSLHGWFQRPSPEQTGELSLILPELGCDPKLFNISQPVRLPGARRGDRYQRLVYLNEKEGSHVSRE